MKKILSTLISFGLLLPSLTTTALADDNPSVMDTFIDSTVNQWQARGYAYNETLFGNFEFDIDENSKVTAEYGISIIGAVNNEAPLQSDSSLRFNMYAEVNLDSTEDDAPFDKLAINTRGVITSIFGDGIYFKLNDANLEAKGIPAADQEDYEDFQKEMQAGVAQFAGQWFYVSEADLLSGFGTLDNNENSLKTLVANFENNLEKKSNKAALSEFITESIALDQGDFISTKEKNELKAFVTTILNTDFFKSREVTAGSNQGFTRFYISRAGLVQFIQDVAENFGETLTQNDLLELNSFLNKVKFSGIYKVNESRGIIDNLKARLLISGIENLKLFNMNIRYKIKEFGKQHIEVPTESVDVMEAVGSLFF